MRSVFLLLVSTILLAGCGDTVGDLKEAVAGINSKANEAATAISIDVHSMRATEIDFDGQTFTINDLFKTILRDVQWFYDESENKQQLKISGTWQDNGLFAEENFSEDLKQQLQENGQVEIFLTFDNNLMTEQKTTVHMKLNGETLIQEQGTDILHHFYQIYLKE